MKIRIKADAVGFSCETARFVTTLICGMMISNIISALCR
jgi:hypothetical protein